MNQIKMALFVILAVAGCEKHGDPCVPQEVPATIKNMITQMQSDNPDCICHDLINQYLWHDQTVYVLSVDDALNTADGYVCDGIPVYYNAEGEKIPFDIGLETYMDFLAGSKFVRTVWVCK